MHLQKFYIFFFLLFVQKFSTAGVPDDDLRGSACEMVELQLRADLRSDLQLTGLRRPSPLLQIFRSKQKLSKKYTAALLAFPFPFGIVGLHRIYLGCAPYVPVVYIASLGGVFGLLPLIDCVVILLDKNVEHYVNNQKVFMWVE